MMLHRHYILNDDNVAIPVDLLTWARWFENTERRRVRRDRWSDGVVVSTVFLGLDHAFDDDGPRQIFETLVFGGEYANECVRYATWAQAEAGHDAMIQHMGREPAPVRRDE